MTTAPYVVDPWFGIVVQSTDQSMPLLEFARAIEERAFAALFLNEHTHIPVDHPTSSYPVTGGDIPERYRRFWDPFIALGFVAATTGLIVGTAISLAAEHDPIILAKEIATLDVLSGGRFVFGVAWGWLREEYENHRHGLSANTRAQVLEEHVWAMKALWTEHQACFDGKYVSFPAVWSWPKPAQTPHPPIFLGAPPRPRTFDRVIRWADGWIPMQSEVASVTFEKQVIALRQTSERAGRDPSTIRLIGLHTFKDVDCLARALDRAHRLGVEGVNIRMFVAQPTATGGDTSLSAESRHFGGTYETSANSLPFLDTVAEAIAKVR